MKRIFFCDIDGTIMDGSRGMYRISDKTKYAIGFLKKDNYVFIASGRCMGLIEQQVIDLFPDGYVLCNGGYAMMGNEEIFSASFDDAAIDAIKDVAERYDGFSIFETVDEMFVDSLKNPYFKQFAELWGINEEDFREMDDEKRRYNISMVGFSNEDSCVKASEELKNFADLRRHHWYMSYDANIKGIDKGIGVRKVMEYLDVPKENCYCFGDGTNDLEMLLEVGHPVRMGNCHQSLKEYDFEDTDDVLDDGFYNYLVRKKIIEPMN